MKRKGTGRKTVLSVFLGFCLLAGTQVYASAATLDVTVGYWGMESYTKMSPTLDELRANCGTNREIYTWIDNKPAAGTTEAEGVYLEDIMAYCGIDAASIGYYNFYTLDADSYAGAWESYSPSGINDGHTLVDCFRQALDAYNGRVSDEDFAEHPENYYRLCNFYNELDERGAAGYTPEAWQRRIKVKPMLALAKNSVRWSGDYPASSLDFSGMTSENMPQLLFGQSSENEITRGNMAKMVSRIHIWFEGSPQITGSTGELEGEVGSVSHIDLDVNTPDDFLTQKIKENIRWTSGDESVATVDDDGNVTFVGEGEVSISAAYTYVDDAGSEQVLQVFSVGGTSKAGTEEGGEEEEPSGGKDGGNGKKDPETGEEGGGKGKRNEKGGGNGQQEMKPGTEEGGGNSPSESGTVDTEGNQAAPFGQKNREEEKYYLADEGNADAKKQPSETKENTDETGLDERIQAAVAPAGGGGVKLYEVKDTVEGLPVTEEENPATKAAGALAAILFASGILGEGISFKYQKTRR